MSAPALRRVNARSASFSSPWPAVGARSSHSNPSRRSAAEMSAASFSAFREPPDVERRCCCRPPAPRGRRSSASKPRPGQAPQRRASQASSRTPKIAGILTPGPRPIANLHPHDRSADGIPPRTTGPTGRRAPQAGLRRPPRSLRPPLGSEGTRSEAEGLPPLSPATQVPPSNGKTPERREPNTRGSSVRKLPALVRPFERRSVEPTP